ncbi:unnamed protein product [Prorocentrum cordatum]|uniref:Pseudouridine synthase RsuA/RluA-like domain-containing protein n=1 Tax=Prorocentrum cordatum TaxID=2364126 RepID=A0ABN9TUB4_9DINO|nr:unnamed protein product [Polarella glacialis]
MTEVALPSRWRPALEGAALLAPLMGRRALTLDQATLDGLLATRRVPMDELRRLAECGAVQGLESCGGLLSGGASADRLSRKDPELVNRKLDDQRIRAADQREDDGDVAKYSSFKYKVGRAMLQRRGGAFVIEAVNYTALGMAFANDWARALTAQGAQMGFTLRPRQFNGARNLHAGQRHQEEREKVISEHQLALGESECISARQGAPPARDGGAPSQARRIAEQINATAERLECKLAIRGRSLRLAEVVEDVQALAGISEDVANWCPQRHPDISTFQAGAMGGEGEGADQWAMGAASAKATCDYEESVDEGPDLRGATSGLLRLAIRSAAEMREMSHLTTDFYFAPVSAWAFRKSLAAGHCYGGLVRERGTGRLLGPPGIHAGMAPMEGISEAATELGKEGAASVEASMVLATDSSNNLLVLVGGSNACSQAAVTEAIKLRKVSESNQARNDEEQFWKEGMGNIQTSTKATPNFRAAPPKDANEEILEKVGKLSGHSSKAAAGVLIAFVGGRNPSRRRPRLSWRGRPRFGLRCLAQRVRDCAAAPAAAEASKLTLAVRPGPESLRRSPHARVQDGSVESHACSRFLVILLPTDAGFWAPCVVTGLGLELFASAEELGSPAPGLLPPKGFGVLLEGPGFVGVDKPSGLRTEDVLDRLRRTHEGAELVSRLDRETSGCLLVPVAPSCAAVLTAQFAGHTDPIQSVHGFGMIQVTPARGRPPRVAGHLALVSGAPPESGTVTAPLGLVEAGGGSRYRAYVDEGGKASETRYRTLWSGGGLALVQASPVTGRTHQIRCHMAHAGFPLVGDKKYSGVPAPAWCARLPLHCLRLQARDEGGGAIELEAGVGAALAGTRSAAAPQT